MMAKGFELELRVQSSEFEGQSCEELWGSSIRHHGGGLKAS